MMIDDGDDDDDLAWTHIMRSMMIHDSIVAAAAVTDAVVADTAVAV